MAAKHSPHEGLRGGGAGKQEHTHDGRKIEKLSKETLQSNQRRSSSPRFSSPTLQLLHFASGPSVEQPDLYLTQRPSPSGGSSVAAVQAGKRWGLMVRHLEARTQRVSASSPRGLWSYFSSALKVMNGHAWKAQKR